jgi:hypothetical protein
VIRLDSAKLGRGAAIAGVALSAVLLFFFAPMEHPFYPRCVFHSLTGLACPGCGSLRAAHEFLHGNFAAAFRLNPFAMTIVPLAIGVWIARGETAFTRLRPICIWAVLAVIILFSILRNLPITPFTYLKP